MYVVKTQAAINFGRLVTTILPEVDYIDDSNSPAAGHLYTHTGYDGLGRRQWQSDTVDVDNPSLVSGDDKRLFEYDAAGRLVKTTLPKPGGASENPVYRYIFDAYGSLSGIMDPCDRLTVFEYDEQGRQVKKYMPFKVASPETILTAQDVYAAIPSSPEPASETRSYDEFGRLDTVTDYKGQAAVYEYYTSDDMLDSAGRPGQLKTQYFYDDSGRQVEVIDPNGHQNLDSLGYDEIVLYGYTVQEPKVARKIRFEYFDDTVGTGNLKGTDKTVTEYEGARRKAVIDARGYGSTAEPQDYRTEYAYDSLGRLVTTILPEVDYIDDSNSPAAGHLYTHTGYDGLGRRQWQSDTVDVDNPSLVSGDDKRLFEYDAAGRLVKTTLPQPGGASENPVYRYIFDAYGSLAGIMDPCDRLTVFVYDELGREVEKYMPFTVASTETILTAQDVYAAIPSSPEPASETRSYDEFGRLDTVTDYMGQATVYEYCDCNDMLDSTGGPGQLKTQYFYDDAEVLCSQFGYTYDTLGRKVTETITEYNELEEQIYTRCYENVYDEEGKITRLNIYASFADYIAENTPEDSVVYTYVPETGQQALVSTEDGGTEDNQIVYTYDKLGRLSDVVAKKINESTTTLTNSYEYNAVGSRASLTYANDNYAEYQYDALNRLTDVTNSQTNGGTVLSSFSYTHYADGMRRSLTETMAETRTITYTYDELNRLIVEDANDGDDGYKTKYTYDLVGNRTKRFIKVTNPTVGIEELTTTYSYDPNTDRLLSEVHDGPEIVAFYFQDRPVYAVAKAGGISHYRMPDETDKNIGHFRAFMLGIPSKLSMYLFRMVVLLLPLVFLAPAFVMLIRKIRKRSAKRRRCRLSLYQQGLCVLLAYIMLITPSGFQELAQADITYDQLSTRDWNSGDRLIEYGHWDGGDERSGNFIAGYDANGSLVEKVTWDMNGTPSVLTDDTKLETITYEYNLQNRLAKVTKSVPGNLDEVTEYKYNPQGIKVQKIEDPDGSPVVTDYLIDSYNHTGYAQTIKETVTDTGTTETTYIIGSDVLAQANSAATDQYLLYDGHGSTRQIVASDGSTIDDSFSYDAYGVMLGGNPTSAPATNLLYAGEQFDVASQMYYNRARWYDTTSGRFNRVDPFSGNYSDPQSLHKYLYCHANPINALDPSGNSVAMGGGFIMNLTVQTFIRATIAAIVFGVMSAIFTKVRGATWTQSIWTGIKTAAITGLVFMSPLFAWGLLVISPILIGVGIAGGDVTKGDIPEIVAYIVAGIALMILFKTPQYKVWEVKTAIKYKLPQAVKNLKTPGASLNPKRNQMWIEATKTGNKATQGSLIHAELADLMRAEKMANLKIEVSYNSKGEIVPYGTKGSVRLDYGVYHNGNLINSPELKPSDVIDGSWLRKASKYTKLSAEDFEAISYGGKL